MSISAMESDLFDEEGDQLLFEVDVFDKQKYTPNGENNINNWAISRQRPLTNFMSEIFCVKLIEITEWMLIWVWYIDNIIILTFIPYNLLYL